MLLTTIQYFILMKQKNACVLINRFRNSQLIVILRHLLRCLDVQLY